MLARLALALSLLLSVCGVARARGPLVVIDPGHGGTNTGAWGPTANRHEKRVTLAIAKRLQRALRKQRPDLRVALTRRDDHYVSLQSRVRRANQLGADAFISIHLNASPTRAQHGFETFVLSSQATNREALRTASRENERQLARGASAPGADAAAILADIAQRGVRRASLSLAQRVQQQLSKARRAAPGRGVRQAPFDVLMGLTMPGVLVEVGFIDHPSEGPELLRPAVQRRIAEALARGIIAYLASAQSHSSAGGVARR
ncbi:MAG: N-acetylmuramoyl-L-alanine amidase [Myxococcales bacterium]|nr:N-acetylmuramoyl-L-alanine amidase [Myxococcales bacterium]